jgi:DNA polymerase III subunit delta
VTAADGTVSNVELTPLVLVVGPEDLLVERAVSSVLSAARSTHEGTEVIDLQGAGYESGSLAVHASPSLFAEPKVLVLHGVDEANEALVGDLLAYVDSPLDDVTLVLCHRGGARAKKVLDAARGAGAKELECPAIKSERDKTDFVIREFRAAKRQIEPEAIRALVEAVGSDLRELASACAQLVADTTGRVDVETVQLYHGGKVEATGFRVADAAVSGRTGEALELLRHALATGLDPVPIVAVLASSLRTLAKVAAAGRSGRSADVARTLGLAPWQVDKARRQLSGWEPTGLARSIMAVAEADAAVKGGGRDPEYAVERAVVTVAGSRVG